MPIASASNPASALLSALHGEQRVTIGFDPPEDLRFLSDARLLTCPGCGAPVVLHAGSLRAHHFAHLPGAVCAMPQTEAETEEHRTGKLLLARWLRRCLPDADVCVEQYLPETNQRADVLLVGKDPEGAQRRVAIEYQCASLPAAEWLRRHRLYRERGTADLWILGGSRCRPAGSGANDESGRWSAIRITELERAMIHNGAPLLFLDSVGTILTAGALCRFRPSGESVGAQASGRMTVRALEDLEWPWAALDWPRASTASPAPTVSARAAIDPSSGSASAERLWVWLANRHQVTPGTVPVLFGMPSHGQEVFLCEPRLWQAALYYRFIHRRTGLAWWLDEVQTWAGAYLPPASSATPRKVLSALRSIQELFGAAGFLSLPVGYRRASARVVADLDTLPRIPEQQTVLQLARYRSTLDRKR